MEENDHQYENNLEQNEDDDAEVEEEDYDEEDDEYEEETGNESEEEEEEEEEYEEESEEEESESKKRNEEVDLQESDEWNRSEVEGLFCPICMEPWAAQGDHHVSCLPCGHLFGLSCITKWIERKGNSVKCPQCNGKFRSKDVRRLFAPKIAAIDEASQKRIQYLEAKCATFKQQHSNWVKEINELKGRVDKLSSVWENYKDDFTLFSTEMKTLVEVFSMEVKKNTEKMHYVEHVFKVFQNKPSLSCWSCKRQETSGNFVDSTFDRQVSSDSFVSQGEVLVDGAQLFDIDPFGDQVFLLARKHKIGGSCILTKVSLMAPHEKEDISLPSQTKELKDLHFSPSNTGLALFVSLDKKISVFSVKSNEIILTYDFPVPAWSCSWDINNPHYIYAGLQSGALMVFDIRQTKNPVESSAGLSTNPIHTIHSLHHDPTLPTGVRTVLSASTDGVCQWNFGGSEERPLQVPEISNLGDCVALAYCPVNNDIVASYRPRAGMFDALTASEHELTPSSAAGQSYFMGIHLHLKRTGNSFEKLGVGCGSVSETRFHRTVIVGLEKEKSFAAAEETVNALILQELPSFSVAQGFKSHKRCISDVKYSSTSSQGILGCLSEGTLQLYCTKLP